MFHLCRNVVRKTIPACRRLLSTGLFGFTGITSPVDMVLFAEAQKKEILRLRKELPRCQTKHQRVCTVDTILNRLDYSLNMIQFCQAACDDAKYVSSANKAFDLLFALNIQLNQDKELYSILKESREKTVPPTKEEDVVLESLIGEYEFEGIDKPADPQKEALSKSIQQLKDRFLFVSFSFSLHSQNIQTNRSRFTVPGKEFFFIPDDLRDVIKALSAIVPETTRKSLYDAFLHAIPENPAILAQLVAQRNEYARRCGKSNFMAFQMHNTLISNPSDVRFFCETVLKSLRPHEEEELRALQGEKDRYFGKHEPFRPWDLYLFKGSLTARRQVISYSVAMTEIREI
ncbi:hypothetical protein WA538_000944 [Blastocystis sp. DL]